MPMESARTSSNAWSEKENHASTSNVLSSRLHSQSHSRDRAKPELLLAKRLQRMTEQVERERQTIMREARPQKPTHGSEPAACGPLETGRARSESAPRTPARLADLLDAAKGKPASHGTVREKNAAEMPERLAERVTEHMRRKADTAHAASAPSSPPGYTGEIDDVADSGDAGTARAKPSREWLATEHWRDRALRLEKKLQQANETLAAEQRMNVALKQKVHWAHNAAERAEAKLRSFKEGQAASEESDSAAVMPNSAGKCDGSCVANKHRLLAAEEEARTWKVKWQQALKGQEEARLQREQLEVSLTRALSEAQHLAQTYMQEAELARYWRQKHDDLLSSNIAARAHSNFAMHTHPVSTISPPRLRHSPLDLERMSEAHLRTSPHLSSPSITPPALHAARRTVQSELDRLKSEITTADALPGLGLSAYAEEVVQAQRSPSGPLQQHVQDSRVSERIEFVRHWLNDTDMPYRAQQQQSAVRSDSFTDGLSGLPESALQVTNTSIPNPPPQPPNPLDGTSSPLTQEQLAHFWRLMQSKADEVQQLMAQCQQLGSLPTDVTARAVAGVPKAMPAVATYLPLPPPPPPPPPPPLAAAATGIDRNARKSTPERPTWDDVMASILQQRTRLKPIDPNARIVPGKRTVPQSPTEKRPLSSSDSDGGVGGSGVGGSVDLASVLMRRFSSIHGHGVEHDPLNATGDSVWSDNEADVVAVKEVAEVAGYADDLSLPRDGVEDANGCSDAQNGL